MKKIPLCIFALLFFGQLYAQKVTVKPNKPQAPHPKHPAHSGPPPVIAPDTSIYHEVERDIKKVIKTFQTIDDSATGRINVNDSVNRQLKEVFPTVFITARVDFAGKPQDNHIRRTYILDNSIGARVEYTDDKKNKFTDYRYIFDFKKQTITNLSCDKSGKKKAYLMDFALLNLSADGTVKMMAVDAHAQASSIIETQDFEDISGYHCRKYVKTDPGGKIEIWLTTDKSLDKPNMQDALMRAFFGSSASIPNSFVDYKSVLKGVPIRLDFYPQKQPFAQKCSITYEKISLGETDATVFSENSYEVKKVATLYELMKLAKD